MKTPRRQQAYGRDYQYAGRVNAALPPSPLVAPFLDWSRGAIHPRLDGLLLDWYDGALGHYFGPHRDSTKKLAPGSPIVTVSLGEVRVFRLTSPKTGGRRDFPAVDGAVFVTPWETYAAWKHEVVKSARWKGRRISITLRAFLD